MKMRLFILKSENKYLENKSYSSLITILNCVRSFVIADFNNDQKIDISVTNMNTHIPSILLGYDNISFANRMIFSTHSLIPPYSNGC